MNQRLLCFVIALVVVSVRMHAQQVQVKDQVTLQPIEMVNVASFARNQVTTTDARGVAQLKDVINPASDSVVFSLVGYESKAFKLDSLRAGDQLTVYLERAAFALDEFVVSAARWKQDKRDIPVKVVSITPEDVQLQAPQTSADLLARSGEVYVQKSQLGGGSPMIRGFATNRVMLSVDGVRMNNAIFRGGNLQNVISIDPLAVERTEVIYGPGSVIYGSDALGGVMSFYTLEPRFSQTDEQLVKGSVVLRTASANFEKTGHFDLNIGGRRFASVTSISYNDFENLTMGAVGPDDYLRPEYAVRIDGRDTVVNNPNPREQVPSGYEQLSLLQKFKWKVAEHHELNYSFLYSSTTDYPRYDRLIRYRDDQLRAAEWYYGPQQWMMHALRYEVDQSNWLFDKARVTAAYQYFEESRHDRDFGRSLRTNRVESVDAYSINVDLEQDIAARHEVFYGGEWVINTVHSRGMDKDIETGQTFAAASRYPDGSTWLSAALYLTDRFRVGERLTLLSGVRYNHVEIDAEFDTTFYSLPFTKAQSNMGALNGSMGVAYRPAPQWQINVNLSTGFRAPNIDDVGKVFDSEPGAVVVPNPDLKPEYAYNADLGVTKVFDDAVKVDATGFFTYLANAMVRRAYNLEGSDSIWYDGEYSAVQAIQNASHAVVYGIQAGFEAKLGGGFSLSSRINVQKGIEELDDGSTAPLRHAAPTFGVTRLSYRKERLRIEMYSEYNASVQAEDMPPSEKEKDYIYALNAEGNPHSPSWYTFNLKTTYTVSDYIMLMAGVENILNERYLPYSSGIVAPGRNFIASARILF